MDWMEDSTSQYADAGGERVGIFYGMKHGFTKTRWTYITGQDPIDNATVVMDAYVSTATGVDH